MSDKKNLDKKKPGAPKKQEPVKKPESPNGFPKILRNISGWILLILIALILYRFFEGKASNQEEISYSKFMNLVSQGAIKSVKIVGTEITATPTERKISQETNEDDGELEYKTYAPSSEIMPAIVEKLEANNIDIESEPADSGWWSGILVYLAPFLILGIIWIFFLRQMQAGGRGIFSFGKSRAKLFSEDQPKVTFDDVAGANEAKEELVEIIDFLKSPEKFQRLGGRIPKGVLLLGAPGVGKTLLAKAVAGEAEVPFFSTSGSDFLEMFVGVGASRVRDLFEQGKQNSPAIIFIDELDAVGRHRGAGLGGGHDEREQTLNQLLTEMDGFEANTGVIILAATNRPDVLDPALLRPGRFDRQIIVDRPDRKGRLGILKVHTRNIPLGDDVKLKVIAKGTPGFSGAEIANMVNEAALLAARREHKKVKMSDFEDAKDKVMMGLERKSMILSDDEKKRTAYHESGHVLVSKLLPGTDPVHKVTIIPRGRALGGTHYLPLDERHNYSKQYLENMLAGMLGGRAAERLILNELTTGASDDISRATDIARRMVCEWGMSDALGPLTFGKKEEEIFLGKEIARHKDYSEATALEIDKEIQGIVTDAQNKAETILTENIDTLHALANALLDKETLDSNDIDMIIEGKEVPEKNDTDEESEEE